jgi:hypothetical protein
MMIPKTKTALMFRRSSPMLFLVGNEVDVEIIGEEPMIKTVVGNGWNAELVEYL